MSLEISEELIARQPPEAQVIIRLLLAKIQELEARLNKSPRNSSLPPSSEHPHGKSPRHKDFGVLSVLSNTQGICLLKPGAPPVFRFELLPIESVLWSQPSAKGDLCT